jgi:hypothetical protein
MLFRNRVPSFLALGLRDSDELTGPSVGNGQTEYFGREMGPIELATGERAARGWDIAATEDLAM